MTTSAQHLALLGALCALDADQQVETERLDADDDRAPAKVQNEKPGRQTAFFSEGATESRVMPVGDEVLDQRLCTLMPAMQTRAGRQTSVSRGATKSSGAHARTIGARSIQYVVPAEHTPTQKSSTYIRIR